MKQRSLTLSLGLSAILCLGLFACSPDSGSPADAGTSGAGGKRSSGGAGGSSAKGGTGGSNAGGSGGSGGAQAGGSQAGGSQAGGSQAGGSQAGGAQAGGSQAGGAGGGSGGTGGSKDGGPGDASGSDAKDAPLPNDDGPAAETPSSDDGGVPVVLDGGAVDIVPPDSVVALDAEIDTTPLDVSADTTEDTAEDSSADTAEDTGEDSAADTDTASDNADAGNCLEQIIAGGYSVGALACSQCKESAGQQISLESQCQTMVDCLAAASCTNKNNANNCFLGCQNQVSGGSQIETGACVSDLMDAAQCPTQ